ncbi:MAG TPA: ATP-binding cassette domain-containing protein [Candidatus Onthocola stercorigallinarum]|nr:ATP-binding cassette domain-containing protein [Candidatus Onthocola stercorigallinarum]
MIKLVNLEKSFDFKVLDKINLEFKPGNIYVLKGKSGSGKTTLLNLISGLDSDYTGSIYINDKKLKNLKKDEITNYRNNIGYMRQECLLYRNLTVLDNLLLIENNKDKIIDLCKKFNIDEIINKYPYEISGGERERVSLIRALLNDNKILLLDEPSANLDKDNSENFVKYLKKIDISDKIIIISTHENIYDDIASVIINIEYGKINLVKDKPNKNKELIIKNNMGKKNLFKGLKIIKKQSIIFRIFTIILLFASLLAISFNLNFKEEYIKVKLEDTPYNIIDVNSMYLEDFEDYINKTYTNYVYKNDNLNVYPLYEYKNSNLKNFLEVGSFPQNNNEVLINFEYATNILNASDLNDLIGTTININNKDYIVVGITSKNKDESPQMYNTNYSYKEIYMSGPNNKEAIFMFNDELKTFGVVDEADMIMIDIKPEYIIDLYNGNLVEVYDTIGSSAFSQYEMGIKSISTDINSITQASLLIVVVVLILTMIFLVNQISMELFYQRKEIGYLQLFHYTKDDISLFMTLRYIKDFVISLIIAIVLYLVLSLMLLLVYNFNLFINVLYLCIFIIILLFYFYIIINIPLNKYLKTDIIKLIR